VSPSELYDLAERMGLSPTALNLVGVVVSLVVAYLVVLRVRRERAETATAHTESPKGREQREVHDALVELFPRLVALDFTNEDLGALGKICEQAKQVFPDAESELVRETNAAAIELAEHRAMQGSSDPAERRHAAQGRTEAIGRLRDLHRELPERLGPVVRGER
jgi:hypothetical protein